MHNRLDKTQAKDRAYRIFCWVLVLILAFLFTFPLYWIITGSFKTPAAINSVTPDWIPKEWVLRNYELLMSKRSAPLFNFKIPFTGLTITGPKIPGALRWLINTVFMSVMSMLITCITSAMAGYVLAKKRFYGGTLIFSLNQALLAARAGATYVSPFVGRLDDINEDGMALIEDIANVFALYPEITTEIISASVRNTSHVMACARAGADIATVPYKVIEQMLKHPLTDSGIVKFQEDYIKVFGA